MFPSCDLIDFCMHPWMLLVYLCFCSCVFGEANSSTPLLMGYEENIVQDSETSSSTC